MKIVCPICHQSGANICSCPLTDEELAFEAELDRQEAESIMIEIIFTGKGNLFIIPSSNRAYSMH